MGGGGVSGRSPRSTLYGPDPRPPGQSSRRRLADVGDSDGFASSAQDFGFRGPASGGGPAAWVSIQAAAGE